MRAATDDYRAPADSCVSYRRCFEGLAELEADTHLHIHKENNVLFPMVVQREQSLAPIVMTLPDLDNRNRIAQFVRDFYRQVAMDDLLGPVFARAQVDWGAHIPKLVDFWAWQLLGEPRYGRNPLRAHEPVHARDPFGPELYERWLELFDATLDDGFHGPVADLAKERAHRMAHALQRLLDGLSAPGCTHGVVTALPTTRRGRNRRGRRVTIGSRFVPPSGRGERRSCTQARRTSTPKHRPR